VTRAVVLAHHTGELHVIRLAVSLGETTVVAVMPPGEKADELFNQARDAGVTRCVRLWDDSLSSTDYLGVAYTLAATVRAVAGDLHAKPTVVLCGDRGRGAVGPAVAERLAVPHLGDVVGATITDGKLVVRRRSGLRVRMYAGKTPAVLCVAGESRPQVAPEAAGWTAAVAETEEWTLGKAGLSPAELGYRRRFKPHPSSGPTSAPRVFADAASLAARLRADGLIGSD
jgi:electron transfer flavoprotein alpha/beta subunit